MIWCNNNFVFGWLDCSCSSLSSVTSPALTAMNWLQISSSATSIALSDRIRFKTFYRTIASDHLQAIGIIRLLEYFNWYRFGILYINDAYGIFIIRYYIINTK